MDFHIENPVHLHFLGQSLVLNLVHDDMSFVCRMLLLYLSFLDDILKILWEKNCEDNTSYFICEAIL